MVSAINNALSGLNAAATRLAVSANNVANQSSTKTKIDGKTVDQPYTPKKVIGESLPTGGVKANVVDVAQPTTTLFNPSDPDADENGSLEVPNVSLEEETVTQLVAAYDFKAALKILDAQRDLDKSLLDIKS